MSKAKQDSEQFIMQTLSRAALPAESANVKPHKGYGFIVMKRQMDIDAAVQVLYGTWWGRTQIWAQRHNDHRNGEGQGQPQNNIPPTQHYSWAMPVNALRGQHVVPDLYNTMVSPFRLVP